jgi:hypothetical protein
MDLAVWRFFAMNDAAVYWLTILACQDDYFAEVDIGS